MYIYNFNYGLKQNIQIQTSLLFLVDFRDGLSLNNFIFFFSAYYAVLKYFVHTRAFSCKLLLNHANLIKRIDMVLIRTTLGIFILIM